MDQRRFFVIPDEDVFIAQQMDEGAEKTLRIAADRQGIIAVAVLFDQLRQCFGKRPAMFLTFNRSPSGDASFPNLTGHS